MFQPVHIHDFTVAESIYGRFILNRKNVSQIDSIVKTGFPHIEHEFGVINDMLAVCDNESIVIDAGANCGLFAIPVAQRTKHRGFKIICFEPQRMMFNALSGSIALNDLRNVFSYHLALGDSNSKVLLPEIDYHPSGETDFGQVQVKKGSISGEHPFLTDRNIKCITIDSMKLDRLDFVKIDVEGFELKVLKGGITTFKKFRPLFFIEHWKVGFEKIVNFFKDNGIFDYQFFMIDGLNMACVPQNKLELLNGKTEEPTSYDPQI